MVKINPHLDRFLANCLEAKAKLEGDDFLMEAIRTEVEDPSEGSYEMGEGIYSKWKRSSKGMTEMCVAADTYAPGLPVMDFVVLVDNPDEIGNDVTYLVPFFPNLIELGSSKRSSLIDREIKEERTRVHDHFLRRGYEIGLSGKSNTPFGISNGKLVVHDVDMGSFTSSSAILRGTNGLRGEYAHLEKIWKILTSDKYRLNI